MYISKANGGLLKGTATKLIEGALEYSAALDLSADFIASLTADRDGYDAAINHHTERKNAERNARATRNSAIEQAQQFVTSTMQVLKPHLGSSYNALWDQAGVPQGSIAVPHTRDELISRIGALKNYLTVNPTHEVAAANVTAAAADAAAKGMADAEGALQAALVNTRTAAQQRDVAQYQLAQRIRVAQETLATKLKADDLRWYGFGMVRPVDVRIPEVPVKPVLRQIGPGTVELTWTKAVRARRYRIFLQQPEDSEPRALETVRELYGIVRDLRAGVKLSFTLVAANGTGESLASEAAEITLS